MEIKKGLFQKSIFPTERHPIFNIETHDTSAFQRDFSSCIVVRKMWKHSFNLTLNRLNLPPTFT